MKSTLVILAAGIGSRFGTGIKQISPVGPNGELIIDYSVYDAMQAGFNKVVFIIRKDIEQEFRDVIGNRIAKKVDVDYVFQDLNDLPQGFSAGARTKPWGTGQALLACKGTVKEPFAVINADDYYGKECFHLLHDSLAAGETAPADILHGLMVGFKLKNTLSENGGVTRGVCQVENERLTGIRETHNIEKIDGKAAVREADGLHVFNDDTPVSMNMWGFSPDFIDLLDDGFRSFLGGLEQGDMKTEYLLPNIVEDLVRRGQAEIRVLPTNDKWFGMTYREDIPAVQAAFVRLYKDGVYTQVL